MRSVPEPFWSPGPPSGELDAFNDNIVGVIEMIAEYR